jgi:hypothetical protein
VCAGASAQEIMAHRLATQAGRKLYAQRKQTIEPVFGIILNAELRSTKDTKSTKGQMVAASAALTHRVSQKNFASRSFRVLSCFSWTLHCRF